MKNCVTVSYLSASLFIPTFTIHFKVNVTTLQYYFIREAAAATRGGEDNVLHSTLPCGIHNAERYEPMSKALNFQHWIGCLGRPLKLLLSGQF